MPNALAVHNPLIHSVLKVSEMDSASSPSISMSSPCKMNPSSRKRRRRSRSGGRSYARGNCVFWATVLRLDVANLSMRTRDPQLLQERPSRYATPSAYFDLLAAVALEEAAASIEQAMRSASKGGRVRAAACREVEQRKGVVSFNVGEAGKRKIEQELRNGVILLVENENGERLLATFAMNGTSMRLLKEGVLQLAVPTSCKMDKRLDYCTVLPLCSVLLQLRMFCAAYARPGVAFLHQLLGGKTSTHIKFCDSSDSEDSSPGDSNLAGSDEEPLSLNTSQGEALDSFKESIVRDKIKVTLVQGPPGTGKTHFLVAALHAVAALRKGGNPLRIMVCAPSNKALVVVVEKFLETGGNMQSIALLGVEDKLEELSDKKHNLQDRFVYSFVDRFVDTLVRECEKCGLEEFTTQLNKSLQFLEDSCPSLAQKQAVKDKTKELYAQSKIVGSERIDSLRLCLEELRDVLNECSVCVDLLNTSQVVFCTLASAGQSYIQAMRPVDVLIVDEAAQALEAEVMIALAQKPKHCMLVGDPMQLPATMLSQPTLKLKFGKSLMERLILECSQEYHVLRVQYRMHPMIASYSNARFYESKLTTSTVVNQRCAQWTAKHAMQHQPLCFIDTPGREFCENGLSYSNPVEANVVACLLQRLESSCGIDPAKQVMVITFYSAQVRRIQHALRKQGHTDVCVASVDSAQGSEADVVVLSFVRSNASAKVGFVKAFQRLNVGVTRAKFQLYAVGNATTLSASGSADLDDLVVRTKKYGSFVNVTNLDSAYD